MVGLYNEHTTAEVTPRRLNSSSEVERPSFILKQAGRKKRIAPYTTAMPQRLSR